MAVDLLLATHSVIPRSSAPIIPALGSPLLAPFMFFNQVFKRSASLASKNTRESELQSVAAPASEESSLDGRSGDSLALSTPEMETKSVDGRRTSLPCVMVGDDSTLFEILKTNMGKVRATHKLAGKLEPFFLGSLIYYLPCVVQRATLIPSEVRTLGTRGYFSLVAMHIHRLAEDLEYVDLLIQAAQTQDPTERFALVAAFAISSYACTKHRPGRKPLYV